MSKILNNLPSKEEMLSIFVDKELIPDNLIVPYYRLAKDIAGDVLTSNSIFFISKHKETFSFRTIYMQLNLNQRYIIIEYYGLSGSEPKTLDELGELLNLSGSRIGQLRVKALRNLKRSKSFERCCVKHLETLSNYYRELSAYYSNEFSEYCNKAKEITASETDIEYLDLSVRANNALYRYGYCTVEVLRKLTKDDLRRIRNIGPKTRDIIWLRLYGKHFEEE